MPDKNGKCFIIMPITTPEALVSTYHNDSNHFQHVLDCLFIPAIEKAGFEPKSPKAKGSDLIHAEIIKTLETADIVLCDVSTLNPNVFFEFGIRTSLNKPVCVVKDEQTKQVPFDTGILNYLEYDSAIHSWNVKNDVEKLAEHLKVSVDRSKSENTLWKYFGFKSEAAPLKADTDTNGKVDFLVSQMETMMNKFENITSKQMRTNQRQNERDETEFTVSNRLSEENNSIRRTIAYNTLKKMLPNKKIALGGSGDEIIVFHQGNISPEIKEDIQNQIFSLLGHRVQFTRTVLKA
jgi:hypothetical protein